MRYRVACLMGTYGRYSVAAEALSCFLQQTAIEEAMLLIYNQHPAPLVFDHPRVRVVNETPPKEPLRLIKKRMLDLMAEEPVEFYHWWDDDDLCLPWHLEDCLNNIGDAPAWKAERSWMSMGDTKFALLPNRYEGAWLLRAAPLRAAPMDTHPDYTDHPFMLQLEDAGTLKQTELGDMSSYIYRWATGTEHISGYGSGDADKQSADIGFWRERSTDLSPDGRIVPADLWPRWQAFLDGIKTQVSPANYEEIETRLSIADAMSKLGAGGGT